MLAGSEEALLRWDWSKVTRGLTSWVESANELMSDFPIQNLPYGVFESGAGDAIGVAIGDKILDLRHCAENGMLSGLPADLIESCRRVSLNALMALGPGRWSTLRRRVTALLEADSDLAMEREKIEGALIAMKDVTMQLPAMIGDYTDFYASIHHATNVGRLFRPDNPLLPNYKYVPIGYHGRASSILPSRSDITRPSGQTKDSAEEIPSFGVSKALDYEAEIGFFVGEGNRLGEPISIENAERHIFGLCLLNDWSARDMQSWEYQPLGPFLAKNFATTISPWIITLEALKPFRVPSYERPSDDPAPLAYLDSLDDRRQGGFDLTVTVGLSSQRMRAAGINPLRLSSSNLRDLYWTLAQLLTHHASNGCNLRSGDLIGTGTLSGAAASSRGCLLEITEKGTKTIQLPTGELRTYLEDGDQVSFHGSCMRDGDVRIGFGACSGTVIVTR